MKHIISFTVIILVTMNMFGQIENIKISSDSTFTIDRLYVGMLSSTAFQVQKMETLQSVDIRVGALISWKPSKYFSIHSFGTLSTNFNQTSGIQQFYIKAASGKWSFFAGQMATISTEMRAHPVSAGGQFETWTQAKVPGGAPGVKLKYQGKVTIGVGIASRYGESEYHVSFSKGKHTISGYYRVSGTQSGFAYMYGGTTLYSILVFMPKSLLATTTVLNLKKEYSLFADIGYGMPGGSLPRMEVGVFKSFSAKWTKGLISVSYDAKTKAVNGYFFVHL